MTRTIRWMVAIARRLSIDDLMVLAGLGLIGSALWTVHPGIALAVMGFLLLFLGYSGKGTANDR